MAALSDRLRGWQARVRGARGFRRVALAFAAGVLSNLAMPPFFFAPMLFATLPALVWLIDGAVRDSRSRWRSALSAALAGWAFGFGYFFFGLFWIGEAFLVESRHLWLLPLAVTLTPAGLAVFWAAAAAAAAWFWRADGWRILVLAVALGVAEWLRGHIFTGFPWNVIGYALTWPVVLMQSAGLLGIYGLTLVAVPLFAAPLVLGAAAAPGAERRRAWFRALAVTGLPLAILATYGAVRLATAPGTDVAGVRIRIVQPSVPQHEKWLPEKQAEIFQEHLDLSRTNPAGVRDDLAGITYLVWPEASMPFMPLDHPEALAAIGDLLPDGTFLLSGALRAEGTATGRTGDFRAFNSLMVFNGAGGVEGIYDKTHLVPLGEYLPWRKTLEAIGLEKLSRVRGSFTEGVMPRPTLSVPGLPPVGGLICYEVIFPGIGSASSRRPGVYVNVTNDGWFGDTTGPRQHFHWARVRAVEEGVPLIRAANNGISAVIDASGRVIGLLGMNVKGTLDSALPSARGAPLYSVFGDNIFLAELMVAVLILSFSERANRATRYDQ